RHAHLAAVSYTHCLSWPWVHGVEFRRNVIRTAPLTSRERRDRVGLANLAARARSVIPKKGWVSGCAHGIVGRGKASPATSAQRQNVPLRVGLGDPSPCAHVVFSKPRRAVESCRRCRALS